VSASFLVVSASCSESKPFSCGQRCDKRLPHCQHRCRLRCHLGECPRTSCEELIVISCRCKRRSIEVECGRRRKEEDEETEHGVQSKDFLYELSCDEQCELEARNRNLAEALGISIPIPSPTGVAEIQKPSDWLLDFARFHRKSVEKLERKFEKFLCGNSQKLAFPTSLDHIQRKFIHELANIYRCDSVSLDKEPFRNVVVTKRNDSRV